MRITETAPAKAGVGLADLRRFAIARSLFFAPDLKVALDRLGFVQADPIRAPARAQDLVLRHRVSGYRAGDLDRRYAELDIEEDFFVNYGFLSRSHHALMHPRAAAAAWGAARTRRARAVLEFIGERGEAHPRQIEERFGYGAVVNAWGGTSNATTHLLDAMHYRGWLRVARRDAGIRIYAPGNLGTGHASRASPAARLDALVDLAVGPYAPLPASSLTSLVRRLRYGAPRLRPGLDAAIARAKRRLAHARVGGTEWYWPEGERPVSAQGSDDDSVRLLSPFDPLVWDRARFERFWGWAYRFEAYTPVAKRKLGYYALPLLWHDQVIGWGNVTMKDGVVATDIGFVGGKAPVASPFRRELEREIDRMCTFLGKPAAAVADIMAAAVPARVGLANLRSRRCRSRIFS